ncbi:hypothetical protein ACFL35_15010 [Candidatus Riflebacteria bacterium]
MEKKSEYMLELESFLQERPPILEGLSYFEFEELKTRAFDNPESPLKLCLDFDRNLLNTAFLFWDFVKFLNYVRDQQPIKLTQKGNLPGKICKELCLKYGLTREAEFWIKEDKNVWQDKTFYLDLIVLLAKEGRFTKKRNNKLTITKAAEKYLKEGKETELYCRLFKIFILKLYWGYSDGFPDCFVIQICIGYSLYLFKKYGDKSRGPDFYANKFRTVFQECIEDFLEHPREKPEEDYFHCYQLRIFERLLKYFGLIEIKRKEKKPGPDESSSIKKTPLFDAFIQFKGEEKNKLNTRN